jgi:hypothetical protein
MTEKKYRWANAHEWLYEAMQQGRVTKIDLFMLCKELDPERIEDYFASDMERDGYFEEEKSEEELDAEELVEETKEIAVENCYYGNPDVCNGDLWQCETCKNFYCQEHNHETDKGQNVECVACEYQRRQNA